MDTAFLVYQKANLYRKEETWTIFLKIIPWWQQKFIYNWIQINFNEKSLENIKTENQILIKRL